MHLVEEVNRHSIKTNGSKIKQVIVYGSYVRGEENKESDVDVLVIVDDSLNPFDVRKSLSDFVFNVLLEKGELISVMAIPEGFFQSYNTPFLLNVKEEGMVV